MALHTAPASLEPPASVPPSSADLVRLFELSPSLLCVVGADGYLLHANPAVERTLGWTAAELRARPFTALVHPDDAAATAASLAGVTSSVGDVDSIECRQLCRAGGSRWIAWTLAGDGPVAHLIGTDVTERRFAQDRAEHLARIVESSTSAIYSVDVGGFVRSWNRSAEEIFGYEAAEIVGSSLDLLVPGELIEEAAASRAGVFAGEDLRGYETRRLRKDGSAVHIVVNAFPLRDSDGRIVGASAIARDVSGERAAQRRLAESESRYLSFLETTNEGVWRIDADGTTDHVNEQLARMLGYEVEEMLGRPLWDFVTAEERDAATAMLGRQTETGRASRHERRYVRKDGTLCWTWLSTIPLFDDAGAPAGMLAMVTDITERHAAEERLREAQAFLAGVVANVADGLLTVDRDGVITHVNPAAERMLGAAGDALLGKGLHDALHPPDGDAARCPGEPCPLAGVHDLRATVRLDDTLVISADARRLPVSLSAAPLRNGGGPSGSVLVFQDISDRKAEQERARRELETLTWIGRVREAIDEGRLVCFEQPIFDLGTGDSVKHELLVRLRDRDGALVLPARFLPVAEQYGLVDEIDRWMIMQAARLAAGGRHVSVNVSAHSLGDRELPAAIERALWEAGADPGLVTFELTETALMEHPDAAVELAHRFAAIGCRFAIDDFGTGYGAFTYLKRLPISYLKIDGEFVRDLAHSHASRHVVKAVVSLAHGFGQRTIAECVEDAETLALLRELGVDYVQGFHLGEPRAAALD